MIPIPALRIARRLMAERIPLAIALVTFLGLGIEGSAADENAASERLRLNPLGSLKPSDLIAFRNKPLFAPSRQPPPAPRPSQGPVAVVSQDVEPPKVRLTGVVEGVAAPMAILQRSDASATSTVRVGDDVDGWRVTSIDSLRILLGKGGRQREYRLFAQDTLSISGPEDTIKSYAANPKVDVGRNIRNILQQR